VAPDNIPRIKKPYFLVGVDIEVRFQLEDFEFADNTDVVAELHDLS
jgi:hypothetical protein